MKKINTMKVEFESRSSNESFARLVCTAFVSQLDPTLEELADIKTAVSEAVTNCVVHAYKDSIGKIYLIGEILEDKTVIIKIKDRGCGIEDVKKAMEPCYSTGNQEERAGLGFTVMEGMMDSIKVKSTYNKGTQIVLKKRIATKEWLNV